MEGMKVLLELTFMALSFLLTIISLYLWLTYRRNRLIFWAATVVGCCGAIGLQVVLERQVIPLIEGSPGSEHLLDLLYHLTGALNVYINTFPYFGILIFYLLYNGFMQYDRWLISGLSVPIWVTLIGYADLSANYIDTTVLTIWGFVYTIAVLALAVYPIITEKDPRLRMHHIAIAVVFCVPLVVLNVFHFASSHVSDRLLTVIPYVIGSSLAILLVLYIRGAFLGVKKRSIQTVHSGTALIHHALKNSMGKVKLNALNIRKSMERERYEDVEWAVGNLLATHEAMMKTVSKIAQAVGDSTAIHKEEHDLAEIVDEVATSLSQYPDLRIMTDLSPTLVLLDREMIMECLYNICTNAVEAMHEKGTLTIRIESNKKKVHLFITDTGIGMNSVQAHNVFEPFYSGKQRTSAHFGLGLYYVQRVVEAHEGSVDIKSKPGRGTTVRLTFKQK